MRNSVDATASVRSGPLSMPQRSPSSAVSSTPTECTAGLTSDQLNSTALKWSENGELSPLDLDRILQLLSQADPVAEALVNRNESAA